MVRRSLRSLPLTLPSPRRGEGNVALPPLRQTLSHRLGHLAPGRAEALEDVDEADLVDGAGVAEALEAFAAVIGADAAGADPAEREMLLGDVEEGAVQGHSAGDGAVQNFFAVAAL